MAALMCGVCSVLISLLIILLYYNNLKNVVDCRICEMFPQRCKKACIFLTNPDGWRTIIGQTKRIDQLSQLSTIRIPFFLNLIAHNLNNMHI